MTATEEKKLVQRLNYGVVFRENGHVILSNEYWLHTYEVSIPEYVPFPNIGRCYKDNSIELATLPLCPSHCNVQVPASIVDIDVGGSFTNPTLISKWENFTITDTITNKVVAVPQQRNISILEAVKLSSIIKHPFFVYVYLRHHGSFEKLM